MIIQSLIVDVGHWLKLLCSFCESDVLLSREKKQRSIEQYSKPFFFVLEEEQAVSITDCLTIVYQASRPSPPLQSGMYTIYSIALNDIDKQIAPQPLIPPAVLYTHHKCPDVFFFRKKLNGKKNARHEISSDFFVRDVSPRFCSPQVTV